MSLKISSLPDIQLRPLVSILMGAFNVENFISDSISSVINSTYENWELIIVDDKSFDNSLKIARQFELRDNRIKVYANENNLGDYQNRNVAASYANGKYLKYLDSDDIIYPWGLVAMVTCMETYPEAAFGVMVHGDDADQKYPILNTGREGYIGYFFKNKYFHMGPSGSIIDHEKFKALGGFSGSSYFGDTELWLKLAGKYSFVSMPHDLIWWRQHGGQQIKQEKLNDNFEKGKFEMLQHLVLSQYLLSNYEKKIIIQNQRNIRSRRVIKNFITGSFGGGREQLIAWNLSLKDLLKSICRNKYIK